MKKRLFCLALAFLMTLGVAPLAALPVFAANPYENLHVESLYFTDADGLVKLEPLGKNNMVPRVVLSKKESSVDFAGKLVVEVFDATGAIVASQTIAVKADNVYHKETVYTMNRNVYVGAPMNLPATAVRAQVRYTNDAGTEQYGNVAQFNPAPTSGGYTGVITMPEPFKSMMDGKFTISKEEGIRQYSTTMSAQALYDWTGATEIFLSTALDPNDATVKGRTGTEKSAPITGRNFADNFKAGMYKNPDGSVENDFIFTLVDDFYSGTGTITGSAYHTIPVNNFSYNNKLGDGVNLNALIRSGSPSGFTWMGSIKRQDDPDITQKWTLVDGYTKVYSTKQNRLHDIVTLYDFETCDEYGMPRPYVLVDTIAEVEATPGTFCQLSSDKGTVYCHPRTGDNVKDIVLNWRDSFLSGIRHTTACNKATIIFENIGFMPRVTDHVNNQFGGDDYEKSVYGFLSCKFAGGPQNNLGMTGKYTAYLNNCVAAYGFRDNYNYHATTSTDNGSRVIEVNCISYMNGSDNRMYESVLDNAANSNNASTAHDGMYVLRVGGRYFNSQGHHVGDGSVAMTMNIGLEIYDITYSPHQGHAINTGTTSRGWVIDCYTTGTRIRNSVTAGKSNTLVLDVVGMMRMGNAGTFYDLPQLTWAKIAAQDWYNGATPPAVPEGGGGDNPGGNQGSGNTGGDNTGGGDSGITPTPGVDQEVYEAVADYSTTQGAKNWFYKYFEIGQYGVANLKDLSYQTSTKYWNNGTDTGLGQIRINGTVIVLEPGNRGDGALVFCAPKDGKISLSMKDGKITMQDGCADIGNLKIYQNDTQIYPASGWLSLGSGQSETFAPMEITVKAGDLIIFRANKGIEEIAQTNKNNSGDKFRINPVIFYLEDEGGETAGVNASASITVGATYGINVYLTPTGAVTAAGIKVGNTMLPGTLQADGSYKVVAATAYARNLLATSVTYYPYYTTAEGTTVATEPITTNAKSLLETYVAGNYEAKAKALAQAALDYATVAEAYFAKQEIPSALANRLAAYDAAITAGTAGMVITDTAGSAYTFAAATLQLGDTINFVLAVGAADGSDLTTLPAGYKITVNGTAITATDFKVTTVGGKKVMATIITGVPEKEFAKTQTFLLQDGAGNTLSTLTYSVSDFCIRGLGAADARNKNMIRAIFAIGQAAAAYNI